MLNCRGLGINIELAKNTINVYRVLFDYFVIKLRSNVNMVLSVIICKAVALQKKVYKSLFLRNASPYPLKTFCFPNGPTGGSTGFTTVFYALAPGLDQSGLREPKNCL